MEIVNRIKHILLILVIQVLRLMYPEAHFEQESKYLGDNFPIIQVK